MSPKTELPAIQFQGLEKIYSFGFLGKKQKALQNLTLDVPQGSIYGFLGANGAGKTTTIKIMMGLQFQSAGEVKIFGQDPNLPEVKQRIGYLPERPYFHESMTMQSFLNFHRSLFKGATKDQKFLSNEELLALVGLSDVSDKSLRSFSKGMLQRAGIAQALVNDPDLVVLDEPMSGLDPVGRREVRDLIFKLNGLGKTIFFSSHILSDVEQVCHRIAFLEKGVLRHEGELKGMLSAKSTGFELTLGGGNLAQLAEAKNARFNGSEAIFRCENSEEVKFLVKEGWEQGAQLISCQRNHMSLEDFLFGRDKEAR